MTDLLQERVAEALWEAMHAGAEAVGPTGAYVDQDMDIIDGRLDMNAAAASLIGSLGLELEWWVYYDDHDGVRMDYDGPFAAAEEAQREADRAWPVLEVNGWTTPLYVKPRIASRNEPQVEESGK
ncbi:hypothetical protein BKG71_03595 [Mycobacteroides chelonae]|uniref:hypothetical protein n=1 Tax=Mycobacteroides chelonae TaxID=1774 RepID=UPI000920ED4B|nr:hypothetical protein [Mycobacteroides chelonae]OHU02531.1 hypothetical protein BKG71_03595 [Mycobacteroides chelonae]